VPDLDELQANRTIGARDQVQRRLLRESLYLPPAEARQRQRAQKRRRRIVSRQQIPPPELSRPNREIVLTIVQMSHILEK
jgi:hypothetical protein